MRLQVFRGANVKLGNWRQVTVSRIEWRVSNLLTGCVVERVHDTRGYVYSHRLSYQKRLYRLLKCEKEATFFMASQVMRITLKAYDHKLVDSSAQKIIETVKKNGSQVSGPVPLPTKKEVVTILRSTHM